MTHNAPLSNTVSLTDDALVLSLMSAQSPTVWRMDLTQARSSALSVEDDGAPGAALVLVTLSGQRTVVARFDTRDSALSVLTDVTGALAGKKTRRAAPSAAARQGSSGIRWGRWLAVIVGVLALAWVALTVGMMVFDTPRPGSDPNIGVARSADDFLDNK